MWWSVLAILGGAATALGSPSCHKGNPANEDRQRAATSAAEAAAAEPVAGRAKGSALAASTTAAPKLEPRQRPWPPPGLPRVATPWCSATMPGLDEDACYALSALSSRDLLIYLGGIVPPQQSSPQLDRLHEILAKTARDAGAVVLLPRGRTGLAPANYPGWWSWPTTRQAFAQWGFKLVEEIEAKQRRLEGMLGTRFQHRYVAGSSAGAYFVALLAIQGALTADGYGAFSGGAPVQLPDDAGKPQQAPFYLGYGTHDTDRVSRSAAALRAELESWQWPTLLRAHPVGHGARKIYLDEAFAFWRSAAGPAPATARSARRSSLATAGGQPDHSPSEEREPKTPARSNK